LLNNEIILPREIDDIKAVYHLYVIRVSADKRERLQQYLKEHGIFTGIHYPIILPELKAYKYLHRDGQGFDISTKISDEIISLPLFPEISEGQINFVTNQIKQFYN
jgi:dTDP-4-amino-4,6-dideoxygalactose transaminase